MKNYIALFFSVYTIGFAGLGFTVINQQEQIISLAKQVNSIDKKIDAMDYLMGLSLRELSQVKIKVKS